MADTVQQNNPPPKEGSGIGVVGIVAIVILVLVAMFVLIWWLPGAGQEQPVEESPGINVNVPLPSNEGGSNEGDDSGGGIY
jgi:flagellar basal body-associated protein FliL